MKWMQINHSSGTDLINVEQLYRIVNSSSSAAIIFYTVGSTSPTTLTFSSLTERNEIFEKFKKVLDSINITRIAAQ